MSQRLPSFPNLDHLKKQAKDVLRVARHRHPPWRLADAQHAVARGYGFPTWADLKGHVEAIRPAARAAPADPRATKEDNRSRPDHPIVGTWAATYPVEDVAGHPPRVENVLVEFALMSDALVLTQIGQDAAGSDVAMKTTIHVDGVDHRVPFGDNVTLRAAWLDAQTLETIARRGEELLWHATYEVSSDGQSLVVSSAERVVRFERVLAE